MRGLKRGRIFLMDDHSFKRVTDRLTVRQQALLLTGRDLWHTAPIHSSGIVPVMMTDGPNGLRKTDDTQLHSVKAVCYPNACATACSWNKEAMALLGNALASECKSERVSVLLGPGVNIKRTPLCGRNFEYFSEDPVLAGELAASYIDGVQSNGIGTCIKHYACNSTEVHRMSANSIVDERALREIYLKAFEIAVKKSQPWMIMAAYNKVNGTLCTQNKELLTDILRDEWGFRGVTVSDWGAVSHRVESLNAGLDLEMPSSGYYNVNKIAKAYREYKVTPETLRTSAGRIIDLTEKSEPALSVKAQEADLDKNHETARKIARDCIVMLKNDGGILPVKKGQRVAVIGARAKQPMIMGFGSSQINAHKIDSPLDEFIRLGIPVSYAPAYDPSDPDKINDDAFDYAKKTAASCDIALVFISASELDVCEGAERLSMQLPASQNAIVEQIASVNRNIAVILTSGSSVTMPWIDKVKGLVQTYLLGEAMGGAVSDVLLGRLSPSGKLAETYPLKLSDCPAYSHMAPDVDDNIEYKESIFVGYRYYDTADIPVLFPFGYGLSYTTFEYSGMKISASDITEDDEIAAEIDVRNTGAYDAAEIVQLYIGCKGDSTVFRPRKELKAFTKVYIKRGETAHIRFELSRDDFAYYSIKAHDWKVETNEYSIMIGSSSKDIKAEKTVMIESLDKKFRERDYYNAVPEYFGKDIKDIPDEAFEYVLGYYLSEFKRDRNDERLTVDDTLDYAKSTEYGTKIGNAVDKLSDIVAAKVSPVYAALLKNSIMGAPMAKFNGSTKGFVNDEMTAALVHLINSGEKGEALKMCLKSLPQSVANIVPSVLDKHFNKD
jgi:beta-glucosidase